MVGAGLEGRCKDNAVAERFFATVKRELIDTRAWPTRAGLPTAIFDYIEGCTTPADCTAASATSARRLRSQHPTPRRPSGGMINTTNCPANRVKRKGGRSGPMRCPLVHLALERKASNAANELAEPLTCRNAELSSQSLHRVGDGGRGHLQALAKVTTPEALSSGKNEEPGFTWVQLAKA